MTVKSGLSFRLRGRPAQWLGLGLLSAGVVGGAGAQSGTEAADVGGSRVEQVTVYPGLASVQRSARVAAGARELVVDCVSPSFDMATLQLEADAGIRLGPVTAISRPRAEVPACQNSPMDARIRQLEDQLAALQAEADGHELVLGYLRALGPEDGASAPRASLPSTGLATTLTTIQRAGQNALAEQHRLTRAQEAIERELNPLRAERDRQQGEATEVRQLRVALAATQEGRVRLRYQVAGPTWAPAYRAALDTAASAVDVERQAQVSQHSGEDWTGVSLRLSTGSPRAATSGPQPQPWTISPRPKVAERTVMPMMAAAPAPAPLMRSKAQAVAEADEPLDFAVQESQDEFATEFEVPGRVTVRSGGQRMAFSLGTARWTAQVRVQTTPQADASAWLVAEVARPEGVWPAGPMQLTRGGQAVGQSIWQPGDDESIRLPFGRDELVRVRVLPGEQHTASTGFIATRAERRITHTFEVENRHRTAIELQVLEASPVSTDEQIKVERQVSPALSTDQWDDQDGVLAWTQRLEAGRTARFSASYVISYPKDLQVIERH